MRNIGLLLALAVVIFLIHKHLQTAPKGNAPGGAYSAEMEDVVGMGSESPLL